MTAFRGKSSLETVQKLVISIHAVKATKMPFWCMFLLAFLASLRATEAYSSGE